MESSTGTFGTAAVSTIEGCAQDKEGVHAHSLHACVLRAQILWALCVYVEAVSVLPQLRMMQKAKVRAACSGLLPTLLTAAAAPHALDSRAHQAFLSHHVVVCAPRCSGEQHRGACVYLQLISRKARGILHGSHHSAVLCASIFPLKSGHGSAAHQAGGLLTLAPASVPDQVVEKFTAHYVFALGLSRFVSCAHWILQLVDGDSFLLQARARANPLEPSHPASPSLALVSTQAPRLATLGLLILPPATTVLHQFQVLALWTRLLWKSTDLEMPSCCPSYHSDLGDCKLKPGTHTCLHTRLTHRCLLLQALGSGLWPVMVLLSEVVQTFILADFWCASPPAVPRTLNPNFVPCSLVCVAAQLPAEHGLPNAHGASVGDTLAHARANERDCHRLLGAGMLCVL